MMKQLCLIAVAITIGSYAMAQTDSVSVEDIDELSLEDLMNVTVVSASKKKESLFDAPLSISSVSKEEIRKAGCTSMIDALRLVPGLIVREITPGNYDVHIRGLDNLPYKSTFNYASNTISLVMIDNRPVYNYFNGGTSWETLPVDINDVEKIEVVRGSSASLYGPNAASGVINIITRRPSKDGLYAVSNVQYGNPTSILPNASVGYDFGRLDIVVSGNYQQHDRHEDQYFRWVDGKKHPYDSIVSALPPGAPLVDANGAPNLKERYPQPKLALEKFGYNAFVNYEISDKSMLSFTGGGQSSRAQSVFIDNLATPLSFRESNTYYADTRVKLNKFTSQFSYLGGKQNAMRGNKGYTYDLNTLDAIAEYEINIKKLSVKPGVGFRNAVYDDSKYSNVSINQGFINGKHTISNIAGSLRSEYLIKEKLKLLASVRADQYNVSDKLFVSWNAGPSYKINDKHMVRAVYSKAYRGPFFYDTYNSNRVPTSILMVIPPNPFPVPVPASIDINGSKSIAPLNITMMEIGYRAKLTSIIMQKSNCSGSRLKTSHTT